MKKWGVQILIFLIAGSLLAGLAFVMAHPEVISDLMDKNNTYSISTTHVDTNKVGSDSTHIKRMDFSRSGHKEK
jgi:hypothetical protein